MATFSRTFLVIWQNGRPTGRRIPWHKHQKWVNFGNSAHFPLEKWQNEHSFPLEKWQVECNFPLEKCIWIFAIWRLNFGNRGTKSLGKVCSEYGNSVEKVRSSGHKSLGKVRKSVADPVEKSVNATSSTNTGTQAVLLPQGFRPEDHASLLHDHVPGRVKSRTPGSVRLVQRNVTLDEIVEG